MTSRSNPDWLAELIASEGTTPPIEAEDRATLVAALIAAASPEALAPQEHERILHATLGRPTDPLAAPSEAETLAAAHADADPLLSTLQAAYDPASISPEAERAIRLSALGHRPAAEHRGQANATRIWAMVAVAAAAVLWVTTAHIKVNEVLPTRHARANLVSARSTSSMFTEPFTNGTTSERIDRIAQAREKDLRENRYLAWGVP